MIKNKSIFTVILILFLLLILKIDYRFIENVECCGDDHDYYIHAETIALDFDLDYTNQLAGNENSRYNNNDKIAPIGFIGSGILSSPFLFIGDILQSYYSEIFDDQEQLFNFRIILYSLSTIFYFFLTYLLTIKSLKVLNLKFKPFEVLIFFLGSGISYYAFERYSMTHIYEAFMSILILYCSLNFYLSKKPNFIYAFLIPFLIFIGISVRWVNYFFFLIPFFAYAFISKNQTIKNRLINQPISYFSTLVAIILFFWHTKTLYGEITFNPQFVYGVSGNIEKFLNSPGSLGFFIYETFKNILVIFFSEEFGLIWFSPILFFTFLFVFVNIFIKGKDKLIFKILLFLSYVQIISIVLMWKSTASSYGFRYLFCLIPISIIIYYDYSSKYKFFLVDKYILFFSIFSFFSILFFETTVDTQLSLDPILNSFGKLSKYSQPNYLTGYLTSIITFDSYLKIFTTSFLGAIFFKILLSIFGISSLLSILSELGLPVENNDFIIYLNNISKISNIKFLFVIFLITFLTTYTYKATAKINKSSKLSKLH